jgi:hypothetical protein
MSDEQTFIPDLVAAVRLSARRTRCSKAARAELRRLVRQARMVDMLDRLVEILLEVA